MPSHQFPSYRESEIVVGTEVHDFGLGSLNGDVDLLSGRDYPLLLPGACGPDVIQLILDTLDHGVAAGRGGASITSQQTATQRSSLFLGKANACTGKFILFSHLILTHILLAQLVSLKLVILRTCRHIVSGLPWISANVLLRTVPKGSRMPQNNGKWWLLCLINNI